MRLFAGTIKLFAMASPLITWILFNILLYYGFSGSTWPNSILSNQNLWIWTTTATAIAGCYTSWVYFRRDSSKSSKKVLYFTSFVHGLLFSSVFFCMFLESFFAKTFQKSFLWEVSQNISHFFGWLCSGLFMLIFPAVTCWFIAVVIHMVLSRSVERLPDEWTYHPPPSPPSEGEGKNNNAT